MDKKLIYIVWYQIIRDGKVYDNQKLFGGRDEALSYSEKISNNEHIYYVQTIENISEDGGAFNSGDTVYQYGTFNPEGEWLYVDV